MPEQEYPSYPAFDGTSYGESHSFNEVNGNFRRDARRSIRVISGPPMVAEHLVRVLKTPVDTGADDRISGSDPFRPDLGLDRDRLLGTTENEAKYSIIDAIGPDAIPWVEELGLNDVIISRPDGTRDAQIAARPTLADGEVSEFAIGFRELLETPGADDRADEDTEEYEYEYPGDKSGFGFAFGEDFGN